VTLLTAGRALSRWLGVEAPVRQFYYRALGTLRSARELTIKNPLYRLTGPPDGLPLPPARLVYLVQGTYGLRAFYTNGVRGAASINAVLARNGLSMDGFRAVLDFGCGCGRIVRHWKHLNGPTIHGSDYNPRLIEYCRRKLPFAQFSVNQPRAQLTYENGAFDFIYAISVFTHLDEAAEDFWIGELRRVLEPGGHLLITVIGTKRLHALTPAQRAQFERGERVAVNQASTGTNDCYVFHPEPFVRAKFGWSFTIADFVPGGQQENQQDVILFRRPVTG
jgi:SAM-dependent methyltransferase